MAAQATRNRDDRGSEPIEVEMNLQASLGAPAQARAGVQPMKQALPLETFSDLQLVLSELVTNSAKYGPGEPITVSVRYDGDAVTGGVSDRSEGRIVLAPEALGQGSAKATADPRQPGRWGLPMVDRLTSDWGLRDRDRTVWFRLSA